VDPNPHLSDNSKKDVDSESNSLYSAFGRCVKRISRESFISEEGLIFLLDHQGSLLQFKAVGNPIRKPISTLGKGALDREGYHVSIGEYGVITTAILPFSYACTHVYLGIEVNGLYSEEVAAAYLKGLLASFLIEPMVGSHRKQDADSQRREDSLHITKRLLSSIDANEVLRVIVENIKELYPSIEVVLWLSHDNLSTSLPVKQLNFNLDEANASVYAFLEGKLIVHHEKQGELHQTRIAAPLRGKQGSYGILELIDANDAIVDEKEIEYISFLAETAGNAFENAQLYQQSQHLVKQLMLINEIAQQLNRSLVLRDILSYVLDKLTETYKADYCAIIRRANQTNKFLISAATKLEHQGLVIDYSQDYFKKLFMQKESVILSDLQEKADDSILFDFHSFLGVPLLSGDKIEGAIVLLAKKSNYFSFDDFKLLEILSQHMNLAITNASLHNEVERMVVTDNLTGLYNRKYLNEYITDSVYKEDVRGSLILIDVDHFKAVNDTYGHLVGDDILLQVSEILKGCIRDSDIAARWGGEELAVYLPGIHQDRAIKVANRIRKQIHEKTKPNVTISCGVAYWDSEAKESVESLFHHADMALYEAKRGGRNQVRSAK
jgi:diguanylate cyclase (GGDEF)-like protein